MQKKESILVLGLGGSGLAASRLLAEEGHAVTAVDRRGAAELRGAMAALAALPVRLLPGAVELPEGPFDRAVVSPGLPPASPWLAALRSRGVPLESELETGWRRRGTARVLAVTGSNGKSSAVKWMAEALQAAGRTAKVAGNYGLPVCDAIRTPPLPEWLVLEVSSAQLETCEALRPEIAVLLNIQVNHMDRYGGMEPYRAAKARLFARAGEGDVCIVPAWDEADLRLRAGGGGRWVTFGTEPEAAYRFQDGRVFCGGEPVFDLKDTYFDNPVLGVNAAACCAALDAAGVPAEAVERAARAFEALPHRRQCVAIRNGVRYIDDSKATSLPALLASLAMERGPVRLIAGGLPKDPDYASVKEKLVRSVKKIYLIGQSQQMMFRAWSPEVPCALCGTMRRAVTEAAHEAAEGETVLLAPGCASFDQFVNFEERGTVFASCVKDLGTAESGNLTGAMGAVDQKE